MYVHNIDDTKFVVNARLHSEENVWAHLDNRLNLNAELVNYKYYVLSQNISETLSDVAIYTFTIVPICSIATCTIIYAVKRKKQKYSF